MYGMRPASFMYSVTTLEPGARLVFTQGFTCRPRRTALRASRPAAISTDGFDVLVQLVMAASLRVSREQAHHKQHQQKQKERTTQKGRDHHRAVTEVIGEAVALA